MNAPGLSPAPLRGTVPETITNAGFLAALFDELIPDEHCWTTAFRCSPSNAQGAEWAGGPIAPTECRDSKGNAYFSVAALKRVEGTAHRQKTHFSRLFVVVLDDAGKCETAHTYRIQTSADKHQIGFRLAKPLGDAGIASRLHEELARNKRIPADKSGNNPVRYVRLPVGINNKYPEPFQCRLEFFDPNCRVELDDLIDALRLDADYIHTGAKNPANNSESAEGGAHPREDDAELIRQILTGESYHDPLLRLTMRYAAEGVSESAINRLFTGVMLATGDTSERGKSRMKDIPRAVRGAFERLASESSDSALSYVDFRKLKDGAPPPRRWVVAEWLPRGSVTALFGRGGHGKTLLAQQLAFAVAAGVEWLGLDTTCGPVIGVFCEDDADEIMRRGFAISTFDTLDIQCQVKGAERLFLDGRAGKSNTLVSFTADSIPAPTPLMVTIREQCAALKPVLVILDNAAQLYAGRENDRHQVTAFCNELTGIAREFDCAVLLLGHTAKVEGSEYSGSTAWDAAVRSRLFLERQEDDTSVLKKVKANYSALDEIRLEYRAGVFTKSEAGDGFKQETLDALKPAILAAVEQSIARKIGVSHKPTARNYVIKEMIDAGVLDDAKRKAARLAMLAMIDAGELIPDAEMPWKTSSRHAVHALGPPP